MFCKKLKCCSGVFKQFIIDSNQQIITSDQKICRNHLSVSSFKQLNLPLQIPKVLCLEFKHALRIRNKSLFFSISYCSSGPKKVLNLKISFCHISKPTTQGFRKCKPFLTIQSCFRNTAVQKLKT